MAKHDIYQLKVTLKHSKPRIWRRLQVPGQTRLDKLHLILQATMGWQNRHLHQFIVSQAYYYGEPHPDDETWGREMLDETQYDLNQIAPAEKSRFVYEYDFGDNWEHLILVEAILPPEEGVLYPRCLKGKMACPPEDVGGIWRYGNFLEAVTDPYHPDHYDRLEWVGGDFDPAAFDLAKINEALHRLTMNNTPRALR